MNFQNQNGYVSFNTTDVGNLVAVFNGGVEFNPNTSSGKVVFYQQGFEIKNSGGSNNIVIDGDGITRGDSTFNIGSYDDPINLISSTEGNVDSLYPHVGYSGSSVGNTNRPYSAVYAERLHGVINYPTYINQTLLVPVGAIICLYGVVAIAGNTFSVTANTVYEGTLDGNSGLNYVTAGTYVALSSNASTSKTILAMRISA